MTETSDRCKHESRHEENGGKDALELLCHQFQRLVSHSVGLEINTELASEEDEHSGPSFLCDSFLNCCS